ncbi:hypothetical protein [Solilutibacter tolerans]|uniref:EF hand n=1 Tax=Solilutibacter tolerans TaxID=1604334 RepID=A0A1N6P723_9GAMM|nr:hypothetical protein [Lysobacter tolerans]SIQ00067.1 EF hand [Lysobacter tolerans]
MTTKRKNALTLGTLAGTLVLSGAAFAVTPLASGYMGDGKHGEGSCGVKSMDNNADGKISKAEFAAAHDGKAEKFASHDLNSDGFITQAEMDKAHAAMKKDKPKAASANDAKAGEGKCGEGKCGGGKCGGSL